MTWSKYAKEGEEKIFAKKNLKGTSYCPGCYRNGWVTRRTKKVVPYFFGLFKRTIVEENSYLRVWNRRTPRYETKDASYCGRCHMVLGWKVSF